MWVIYNVYICGAALHMCQMYICWPNISLPLCSEWKDKQGFYTWRWNGISALDQRRLQGNSRHSRLGDMSGQHMLEKDGAYDNQNENIFFSSSQRGPVGNHNVKWCVVYCEYKQILCGTGMWNACFGYKYCKSGMSIDSYINIETMGDL